MTKETCSYGSRRETPAYHYLQIKHHISGLGQRLFKRPGGKLRKAEEGGQCKKTDSIQSLSLAFGAYKWKIDNRIKGEGILEVISLALCSVQETATVSLAGGHPASA